MRLTTLKETTIDLSKLFLRNNLKQLKTTVFSFLHTNLVMKELHYSSRQVVSRLFLRNNPTTLVPQVSSPQPCFHSNLRDVSIFADCRSPESGRLRGSRPSSACQPLRTPLYSPIQLSDYEPSSRIEPLFQFQNPSYDPYL